MYTLAVGGGQKHICNFVILVEQNLIRRNMQHIYNRHKQIDKQELSSS